MNQLLLTLYSDTPAIDSGVTVAQFFVGCNSMLCDIYGIKTGKQFVNTLEDNIQEHGAPNKLSSVIVPKLKSVSRFKTSFVLFLLEAGKVNPTNSNRILLNGIFSLSRLLPTPSLTALVPPQALGYFASSMSAFS